MSIMSPVLIFGVLAVAGFSFVILPIWAIVDALQASEARWDAIGQSRTVWVVLIAVGTIFGAFCGLILAVVYLLTVRPKLAATQVQGST